MRYWICNNVLGYRNFLLDCFRFAIRIFNDDGSSCLLCCMPVYRPVFDLDFVFVSIFVSFDDDRVNVVFAVTKFVIVRNRCLSFDRVTDFACKLEVTYFLVVIINIDEFNMTSQYSPYPDRVVVSVFVRFNFNRCDILFAIAECIALRNCCICACHLTNFASEVKIANFLITIIDVNEFNMTSSFLRLVCNFDLACLPWMIRCYCVNTRGFIFIARVIRFDVCCITGQLMNEIFRPILRFGCCPIAIDDFSCYGISID